MTSVELLVSLQLLISGAVLEGISQGHWTDFTRPVEHPHLRIALYGLARIMMLYGFIGLGMPIIGTWAPLLAQIYMGYWLWQKFEGDDDE